MNYLIILLILTVPVPAYQTQAARNKGESPNKSTETQKYANSKDKVIVASISENPKTTIPSDSNRKDETATKTSDAPDWTNRVNAFSTLIIAIFTVLLFAGLVVQISTSRAIERAWVMVEIQPDPEKPSDGRLQVFESSGTDGDSTAAINAVLNCSNAGKTPAWIQETIAKFEMVKSLPETPNFESAQSVQRSTIPLGMAEGGTVPHSQKIRWTPIAKGHQKTDEMAVIYGRVAYRDIFGRRRTTTFGFKIRPHGGLERLEGHSEYNKNT